jgi:membrane protease YdiL (CAAX protease family)
MATAVQSKTYVQETSAPSFFTRAAGCCAAAAKKTAECAKNLGLGFGMGLFMPFISGSVAAAARYTGLIPPVSMGTIGDTGKNITDLIGQALEEKFPGQKFSAAEIQAVAAGYIVVVGPVLEEVAMRWLLQDVILKPLFHLINPEERLFSAQTEKIARVAIASTAFSAIHLANAAALPWAYVASQLVATLVGGAMLGAIKESSLGLSGSIGAHMGNNALGFAVLVAAS